VRSSRRVRALRLLTSVSPGLAWTVAAFVVAEAVLPNLTLIAMIVVLDGGRVIETGSHDELMAAGGHYAQLYALQARAYLDDGASPTR
jgi:ATP-binding cassette subfamily B protein